MDNSLKKILIGGISFLSGMGLAAILHTYSPKTIPNTLDVEKGYIPPRNLEVICEDRNNDGLPETYLKIKREIYRLQESDGVPALLLK